MTDQVRELTAFLTVQEFAAQTRSDPRTVRRGIRRGEIPAVRFSGTTRIPASALTPRRGGDDAA